MKRVFTKLALVLLVLIAYTNFTIGQSCPPVENLTATVNSDNTVTLNWDNPVPPSTCSGDLYFEFFLGTVYIGYDGTDDLTTWTTNVLANGTHTLRVKVYYFNSSGDYICRAESSTTVTITGSFDCPPVENLTATINSDNTVTLNWDNPDPSTCPSTDIDYWFYNGDTYIAYDYTDGLTSCPIPMLEQGIYNFGVQVAYYESVYFICKTDTVFVEVNITNDYTCPPVENLTATINSDNTVTLNWTIPELPSTCSGKLYFEFYRGNINVGATSNNYNLTSWTTNVLANGTHTLRVKVKYFNDNHIFNSICYAESSITVTITGSFDCPPVENLTATVNSDNTVTLNWDNPVPPSTCSGKLYFEFFLGTVYIGHGGTDDLTTWTTNVLANGTYTLSVVVRYKNSSGNFICDAEANTTVTITGSFDCPPVENLTATINSDNTVTLNWDNSDPSFWSSTNMTYWFYDGDEQIGSDWTDGLTSWTTPMLEQGTYNFGVQVAYYESSYFICKTDTVFVEVNITNDYTCPPVENLTATINSDNTVTLNWTIPELPSTCSGNLYFEFYLGTVSIGYDGTDDLTSWTTPILTDGNHTLTVVIYYYNDSNDIICFAEASVTVSTDVEEIRSTLFSAEIFPKPAKDMLNIVSDSEIISYELYDAVGRLMLNDSNVSNTESIVNVSSLKHGMYMLRLNTVNGSGMFKIIKNE